MRGMWCKVSAVGALSVAVLLLLHTKLDLDFIFVGRNWTQTSIDRSNVTTSKSPGRAADDGRWIDFSRPPLYVFFAFSAFLVENSPSDVVRPGPGFKGRNSQGVSAPYLPPTEWPVTREMHDDMFNCKIFQTFTTFF